MAQQTADEHRTGQEALVSLIPAVLREAWPLLDLHNLKGTLPAFTAAVKAIVGRYGQASATAALQYYRQERLAADVTGPVTLRLAPSPADSVIEQAVGWATSDLYGPVTPVSEQAALDRLDEAVAQLVLDQGRDTIIGNAHRDPKAKGWVRVTEPGACSFCVMLALRGATYKAKASADFQAHDNCRCHVEPIFNAYEPSAQMREYQRMWADATKGRSGHDARVAFRQAMEGRKVTGSKDAPKPKVGVVAHNMTRAQIEHQIALLQGLKDSAYKSRRLRELKSLLRK